MIQPFNQTLDSNITIAFITYDTSKNNNNLTNITLSKYDMDSSWNFYYAGYTFTNKVFFFIYCSRSGKSYSKFIPGINHYPLNKFNFLGFTLGSYNSN